MRIGIISDVHGNIYAFEKAAAELKADKPDFIVFLGDLVFNGLYPMECYDLLKTLNPYICIKGNTDSNIEEFSDFKPQNDFERSLYSMIEFTDARISSEFKDELKSWKISEKQAFDGTDFLFCHGSPWSFKDKLTLEDNDLSMLLNQLENEPEHDIICGHTHISEQFEYAGKRFTNFGAVGYHYDISDMTRYGIIETGREIEFIFREAAYDVGKYKSDIRKQNPVFAESLLMLLEHGMRKTNELKYKK